MTDSPHPRPFPSKPPEACPAFEPDLSAWLDGELLPERRVLVASHVAACAGCGRVARRLEGVRAALRRWDAEETRYAHSTAFRNRVMSQIGHPRQAPVAERTAPVHTPASSRWGARAGLAAAGLLLAAGLGYGLVELDRLGSDDRVEALERQVARMERLLSDTPAPSVSPAVARSLDPVEIEALGAVVSRADLADLAEFEEQVPLAPGDVAWVSRGENQLTHPASDALRDFALERLTLLNEERTREATAAAVAGGGDRPTAGAPPPARLAQALAAVEVAEGAYTDYEDVQVWPLVLDPALQVRALPLLDPEQAMRTRELVVTDEHGKVMVENGSADHAVLLMAGDILKGPGQRGDRVAERDLYLLPGQRHPVRTLTSGPQKTGATSYRRYRSALGLAPVGLRSLLADGVAQGRFDAASKDVMTALATSPTKSLRRIYSNEHVTQPVERQVEAFAPRLDDESVVGFAVVIGQHVTGIEVFGDHATFESARKRVLRSYLLDAAARARSDVGDGASRRSDVTALLSAARRGDFVAEGEFSVFQSPGAGPFGFGVFGAHGLVHATVYPRPAGGIAALVADDAGGGQDPRGGVGRPETGRDAPSDGPKKGSDSGGGLKPQKK